MLINSIEELKKYISDQNRENELVFEDLVIGFELNFRELFGDIGSKESQLSIGSKIDFINVKCPKINFINFEFKNELVIGHTCEIDDISFNSCRFCDEDEINLAIICAINNTIDIRNCHITFSVLISLSNKIKNIVIEDTIIGKDLYFDNLNIDDKGKLEIIGTYSKIQGICRLYNTILHNNTTLSFRCDIEGELQLYNINEYNKTINDKLEFHGANISTLRFYKCYINIIESENSIIHDVYENRSKFYNLNGEILQIFRDSALKNNNEILSIKYKGELYDYYLNNDKKFNLSCRDKFLLKINKLSNNHNRDWSRGVIFTLLGISFLYILLNFIGMEEEWFVLDCSSENIKKVIIGYLYILDVFKMLDLNVNFSLNSLGICILFITRIFATYGIWQTIYAFYKFRR